MWRSVSRKHLQHDPIKTNHLRKQEVIVASQASTISLQFRGSELHSVYKLDEWHDGILSLFESSAEVLQDE